MLWILSDYEIPSKNCERAELSQTSVLQTSLARLIFSNGQIEEEPRNTDESQNRHLQRRASI
jgi:hypothetical protein